MPGIEVDIHFDVMKSMNLVRQLTQSVDQLKLKMDAGGWVRVDDRSDALKMSIKTIVLCAWHYPAPCIEFSAWKSSAEPSIFQAHAIRASFGRIYEWIRID